MSPGPATNRNPHLQGAARPFVWSRGSPRTACLDRHRHHEIFGLAPPSLSACRSAVLSFFKLDAFVGSFRCLGHACQCVLMIPVSTDIRETTAGENLEKKCGVKLMTLFYQLISFVHLVSLPRKYSRDGSGGGGAGICCCLQRYS